MDADVNDSSFYYQPLRSPRFLFPGFEPRLSFLKSQGGYEQRMSNQEKDNLPLFTEMLRTLPGFGNSS